MRDPGNIRDYATSLESWLRVDNPTIEQLLLLTPHIDDALVRGKFDWVVNGTPEAIMAIFDEEDAQPTGNSGYRSWNFAVPGLHVQGAHYTFCLLMSPDAKLTLRGPYSSNVLIPRTGRFTDHAQSAHEWQKANLVYDSLLNPLGDDDQPRWGWFQPNPVRDPSRRVSPGGPITVEKGMQEGRPVLVANIAYVYKKGMTPNERQHHQWRAIEDDADLIIHNSQKLLWVEVKGANSSQGGCPTNYCGLCGNALGLTGCGYCNYLYRDNHFDTGGGSPIGPKAQAIVEEFDNWTFTKDPQIARDEEDEDDEMRQQKAEWLARSTRCRVYDIDTVPVVLAIQHDKEACDRYYAWLLKASTGRSPPIVAKGVLGPQDFCWTGHVRHWIWVREFQADIGEGKTETLQWRLFASKRGYTLEVENKQALHMKPLYKIALQALADFIRVWEAGDGD